MTATMVLDAARAYRAAGLSFIPIRRDGSKAPGGARLPTKWDEEEAKHVATWDPFKARLPTEEEIRRWFEKQNPPGIGVIGGGVSKNLETLDFDREAETIFPAWCELVESEAPGLVERLSVARTPKPGFHVRYRCAEIEIPGNMDLAIVPNAPPGQRILIETRGEGGYAVAPGSPLECHETHRPYEHYSGPKLSQVQNITAAEREILIRCAICFDRSIAEDDRPPTPAGAASHGPRVGDDFNARGPSWTDLLTPHGWVMTRETGGKAYWRRPGKNEGWSATTGHCRSQAGHDLVAVFTSNAPPFEIPVGKKCGCYTKFSAYTWLNHKGDFKEATKALAAEGYGEQRHERNGQHTAEKAKESGAPNDAAGAPWEPPVPFSDDLPLPPFPSSCFPSWMDGWVEAEAEATQTPVDLPAMLALVFAGAGLAKKFRVEIRPGWTEPTNLYGVVALLPGERKSVVFKAAREPVQAYESELQGQEAPKIAELASERRTIEARMKAAESKAAKGTNIVERDRARNEAKKLAKELAATEVPDLPQLTCDDVTPEKLTNLLARQGGRMLQASAEGTAFEIAGGRYSEKPNFDVYLKGHAGDPLRCNRISRNSDVVEEPALSAALTVQPDVIRGLGDHATMRGRGFLARFLYMMPMSRVGKRKVCPAPVPADVAQRYHDNMMALWRLKEGAGAQVACAADVLVFSEAANQAMQAFETWLEPQLEDGETLSQLAGWANKLAGAAARIAGILHVAAEIDRDGPLPLEIQVATVEAAIRLARDYLLPHALRAFSVMGTDERLEDARRAVAWLAEFCDFVNHMQGPFVSQRDLHANVFGGRRSVEDVDRVIQLLERLGYLRPVDAQPSGGRGRPKGPGFLVNPHIGGKGAGNTFTKSQKSAAGGDAPQTGGATTFTKSQKGDPDVGDGHGDAWEG